MDHEVARARATTARRRDRFFYSGTAIVAAALVFAGFARTFYLKRYFEDRPLDAIFVLHGTVFTSWFVLLLVQTSLVAAGRTDLHRRVGIAGAVIAVLMIVLGPLTAIAAARRGTMSLAFLATPLFDVVVFGITVAAALYQRRRSETHKRLMLVATIAILPPAIARLPFDFLRGPLEIFGVTDLILLGCIAYDTAARRRLHPAFLWSGILLVASHPLRVAVGGTSTWLAFAGWLIGRITR